MRPSAALDAACEAAASRINAILVELTPATPEALPLLREALGSPPDLAMRRIEDDGGHAVTVLTLAPDVNSRLTDVLGAAAGGGSRVGSDTVATDQLRTAGDALRALLDGKYVAVGGSKGSAYALAHAQFPQRQPMEPPNEVVLQGPHVGFVESTGANIAILRQFLRSPALRIDRFTFPQAGGVAVSLLYVHGAAKPELVAALRKRLGTFDPGYSIQGSNTVQQWLNGWRGRVLPLVETTERPDKVARSLQEGRAALFVDASPVALLAPAVFVSFFEMTGDHLVMPWVATLLRSLRVISMLLAASVSALFVAVATVNVNVLPLALFNSISQSRQGVPFPTVVEILIMEVLVEVMREASVLMPGPLGQSIAVLGAIILGQSAVAAGIVSAPVIVVVALGYIASLSIPSYDLAYVIRVARFGLIGLGAYLGLNGVFWGLALGLVGLASLTSFGVPYLSPLAPVRPTGIADAVLRQAFPGRRDSIWRWSPSRRG